MGTVHPHEDQIDELLRRQRAEREAKQQEEDIDGEITLDEDYPSLPFNVVVNDDDDDDDDAEEDDNPLMEDIFAKDDDDQPDYIIVESRPLEPVAEYVTTIHYGRQEEVEAAIEKANAALKEEQQSISLEEQLRIEQDRLLRETPIEALFMHHNDESYADRAIDLIMRNLLQQSETEATVRAIEMVNSKRKIEDFLHKQLALSRTLVSILRDCKIIVPTKVTTDAITKELVWGEYLDFVHGDFFTLDEIIKGMIYLHTTYGPNARKLREAQEGFAQSQSVNATLLEQNAELSSRYLSLQQEYAKLREYEDLVKSVQLINMADDERQYVIYRKREVEAQPSVRVRKINRKFKRLTKAYTDKGMAPPKNLAVSVSSEAKTKLVETWIGISDSDLRDDADHNRLADDYYETVHSIGAAMKFRTHEAAQAVLDMLINTRTKMKKSKTHKYRGPANPHHYEILQIVMRRV